MTLARMRAVAADVLLLMLLGGGVLPSSLAAQEEPRVIERPGGQRMTVEEVESDAKRVTFEVLPNGNVVRTEEDLPAVRITYENTLPIDLTVEIPASKRCSAVLSISYAQLDTVADIEGSLDNPTCAASSGAYTLGVSIRDANGTAQTLEFSGAWQRNDAQALDVRAQVPIGADVDLTRVRVRRVTCMCEDAPEAAAVGE